MKAKVYCRLDCNKRKTAMNDCDGDYSRNLCCNADCELLKDELNEDKFSKSIPQKQSVTIEGWVARNDENEVLLFKRRPSMCGGGWYTYEYPIELPANSFPDLKLEDEPRKVRIKIEEI